MKFSFCGPLGKVVYFFVTLGSLEVFEDSCNRRISLCIFYLSLCLIYFCLIYFVQPSLHSTLKEVSSIRQSLCNLFLRQLDNQFELLFFGMALWSTHWFPWNMVLAPYLSRIWRWFFQQCILGFFPLFLQVVLSYGKTFYSSEYRKICILQWTCFIQLLYFCLVRLP